MTLAAALAVGACNAPKSDGTAKHDSAPPTTTTASNQPPQSAPAAEQPTATPAAINVAMVTGVEGVLGADKLAPNFKWKGADGKDRSLKDYRGKVVMLNFWGTWCPPCRAELPDIVKLRNELGDKGFEVIGLGVGEMPKGGKTVEQNVADFAQKNSLHYPLLIASDDLISAYGGISGVPTTFILNGEGKVIDKMVGMRDAETFRQSIQKAM
jgi:thiol-disulfide isomerase/thioredoxin